VTERVAGRVDDNDRRGENGSVENGAEERTSEKKFLMEKRAPRRELLCEEKVSEERTAP
jgi:hypothetical protein